MVQSNKVLTVSYGTFSCTLEGFEDSFGTMKAIAEYFRDLSADDRYFGAEPVQPDADMLAQIAQREISRRVEAHKSSNGIVLRAEQASGLATAALAAGAATAAPAASAEAEAEAEPDEVAEAVTDQVVPEAEQPIVEEAPAQVAEPTPVEPQQAADVGPETEVVDDDIAEAVAEPVAAADAIPVAEDIEVSDVVPAADSIAAKLNRIRAVVSRNEALDVEDEYEDDQDAEAFLSSTADVLAAHLNADEDLSDTNGDDDRLSELLGQLDADDDADDDDANKETAELADVDVSASDAVEDAKKAEIAEREEIPVLDADKSDADQLDDDDHFDDDIDDDDIWAAEEAWNVLADDDFDTEIETRADTAAGSDRVIEKAAEINDAAEADELQHAGEKSDAAEFFNVYDGDDDYDDDDDELFADLADTSKADTTDDERLAALTDDDLDDADVDQSAAQVLKVRRADLEAALEDGSVEKVDDTDTGSTLSPEAEDDLMRELAEVEAEIAVPDNTDKTETEDTDQTDDDQTLARSLDDDDEDLSRLMSAASTKMEEPESTSRREAYNHLRAAVAAAKADTSIRDEASGEKASQAFHSDLESVVRPRRPEVSATARQSRPSDERPAPLKLVAEQRVDIIAEQSTHGPVRPRRVETREDDMPAPQTDDAEGGFAEFAREMGATELPDLLEAAAAYMSFVEGRDQFSRPQLMTKVRQVEMRDFNREDGLRSFGKLLRDGKIEKISGGRFTASEQIGFKPQDRAAG